MIIVFLGTRAQLIKMAPVVRELMRRGAPFKLVYTGQHKETMERLAEDFGIPRPSDYVYTGSEVTGIFQMAGWFLRCLWTILRRPGAYLPAQPSPNDVIVVHGDTFSTLLGALIGRLKGVDVAHVEAGLRSHNIFHPFPEELTRLAVFRLSRIAFCPGDWAYDNMKGLRLEKVNTVDNTLLDAVALAVDAPIGPLRVPRGNYGVCSIHRFENIFSRRRLTAIVELIEEVAEKFPMLFVLHPATRNRLSGLGLLSRLEQNPQVMLSPRIGYIEFMKLLQRSKFVITDGGGNQEELSYLGIPTLLMRKVTERQEGLGRTAVLCGYDRSVARAFVKNLAATPCFHSPQRPKERSPSEIIVDRLAAYA